MACLSIWGNRIGHPYMCQVHGDQREFSNLLALSPLHTKLVQHITNLATNIELVLSPDATYQLATLDGKPFEHPEAFYVVQRMASDPKVYPHLHQLLMSFFQGALEMLSRFTTEFAIKGPIVNTSSEQRELAHMETTNDANEGALGTFRVTAWHAPRISLRQFNARLKFKKNKTGVWKKSSLSLSSRQFPHGHARKIDASGLEKKCHKAQADYDNQVVEKHQVDDKRKAEKKAAVNAKFSSYIPCTSLDDLSRLKVSELDFQLRWHRRFDEHVLRAKDM